MEKFFQINCGEMFPHLFRVQAGIFVTIFETNSGWAMIDSGYGLKDFDHPNLIFQMFTSFTRTPHQPTVCAIHQIKNFGLQPQQIKHIILTHMHIDHAGGITDFPWATVHVYEKEYHAAIKKTGHLRLGYNHRQWMHHLHWQKYRETDSTWFGFPAIKLPGFSPEIFLIPMPGHTPGHCMVAFFSGGKWILQTGSAAYPFYLPREQQASAPGWFQRWLMGENLPQLKQLCQDHGNEIQFLSSHEFRRNKKEQTSERQ
jgi:glyoxylase-like metal-dependent hydrolase (beta-lactamase superfamily II)